MTVLRNSGDQTEVLLVGCGNMGFALLKGWLNDNIQLRAHVVEPVLALRERAASVGASVYENAIDVPKSSLPQAIVLAVKPQYVAQTLADYQDFVSQGAIILSVAAGVTVATLESALGVKAPVVRCMPNTPSAIGAGALVCYMNVESGDREAEIARQLLSPSGIVHFVTDEAMMDAVTAISGSGPAYVFNFIECLIAAGQSAGLPEELARQLAVQTVYGASLLAKNSEQSVTDLRQQVTSPNGTTAAALAVLMAPDGLLILLEKAVAAAKARSIELGRS